MVLTAANVRVGVTGAVYMAPAGTALPTSTVAALNVAFVDLGYISEDGVSTSVGVDVTDIKAWQNGDVVRRVQTSHDFTAAFTAIETNAAVLEAFYGNYASNVVEVTGTQGFRGSFVIDVDDGTEDIRIVIPDGQITERGDINYVNGDAVSYPMTITTYPDTSQVKAYIYTTI